MRLVVVRRSEDPEAVGGSSVSAVASWGSWLIWYVVQIKAEIILVPQTSKFGDLDVLHYRFFLFAHATILGHQPAVQRPMVDATWLPSRRVIRHGERPRSRPQPLQGFPC